MTPSEFIKKIPNREILMDYFENKHQKSFINWNLRVSNFIPRMEQV